MGTAKAMTAKPSRRVRRVQSAISNKSVTRVKRLEEAIKLIMAAAGIPDPLDALRAIIRIADTALALAKED